MKTPILFIIFNRPDYTLVTFGAIAKARPKTLFIAADGPRSHVTGEDEICRNLRENILALIDWECDVKTLFREANLGCGLGVSGAINWFFQNVEEGIILEDDCVPSASFFTFCTLMLERYRDDKRISMVTGSNLLSDELQDRDAYFYSKYYHIWGWATWRRSWENYDISMPSWLIENAKDHLFWNIGDVQIRDRLVARFNAAKNIDTWDYQWAQNCIFQNTLSITPVKNLITNIGEIGAHMTKSNKSPHVNKKSQEIDCSSLSAPEFMIADGVLDLIQYRQVINLNTVTDVPKKKKLSRRIRHWIFQLRLKKGKKILKILGVYFIREGS
ncbi:MAG: hypothetical protein ACSHX0_12360 [Akkermansiaceae bacterium]